MSTPTQTQRIPRADLERMLREVAEYLEREEQQGLSNLSGTRWYRDRLITLLRRIDREACLPVAQDQVEEKDKSTPDRYGYPYHGEQIPDGKVILQRLQFVLQNLSPRYGTEAMNAVAVAMGLESVNE